MYAGHILISSVTSQYVATLVTVSGIPCGRHQLQNVCVDDHTSTISHTCYCLLTSAEKDARLSNLHHSFSQRNAALKANINRPIQTQSLPLALQENDTSDIISVITDVTGLVEENFPTHTPQRIFWDQQMQYNRLKNKWQMRWHPVCTALEIPVNICLQGSI